MENKLTKRPKLGGKSTRRRQVKRTAPPELPLEGEVPATLLPLWKSQLDAEYQFQGVAGLGKTGVAYRIVRRSSALEYCLKTVRPELIGKTDFDRVRETLAKEVEILRPLKHRCLPAIFSENTTGTLPYYVCTFHPGKTIENFIDSGQMLGVNESFFAVSSLLSVLEYLHSEGRPHCDLHTKNVMIDPDVFRHGLMVIDFSSGHRDSDPNPLTPNRGIPFVKETGDKGLYHQVVLRSEMSAGFKRADFRALGTLLATMAGRFFWGASPVQTQSYRRFCHDLSAGTVKDWANARERLLSVIDPMRKVTILNRLFEDSRGQRQAIPLPVSRLVSVGERPLAVINTADFQNLRRLNQLSFCDWRFPGATHTRFEHALGVFNLVRKAIGNLCNDVHFRDHYTVEQLKGCLLAGLLHDVGHYPLAHVIEQYAAGGRLQHDASIRSDVLHTTHSKALLESNGELRAAIEKNWGEEALITCIEILQGKHGVLAALIDGAMDCDKMDYLTRDAHHCGLRFGRGLDIENLLRNLCQSRDGKALAVVEAGVSGLEGLMVLQHQMLASVYWHPTVRGIVCMLHAALAYITKRDADKLRRIVQDLRTRRTIREGVEKVLFPAIRRLGSESSRELMPLVNLHVAPRYTDIYRPIRTYRLSDERREREAVTIYSSINHVTSTQTTASVQPVDWPNVGKLRKAFRAAFHEKGITAGASEIIVDVPLGKTSHRSLPVKREDGSECDIVEVSHLNPTIFEQPAIFESPIRVYLSPSLYRQAEQMLSSIVSSAEERFHHPIEEKTPAQ